MTKPRQPVRVYVCECGPLLRDALDLDELVRQAAADGAVEGTARHATLCSEEGQAWMQQDLAEHPDCAVVVAGCSPREHQATFMGVCKRAGRNPYLLALANIREQCAWVTADKDLATRKAVVLTRAAVARAASLEPIEPPSKECRTEALVIGGGIAGLTATRLLAEAGRSVVLVERAGFLGGRATLLSEIFPSGACASCMASPMIDDVLHHEGVEVLTLSEVEQVLGYAGNFTVRIRKKARHVDLEGCLACGSCHEACPVSVPNEVDLGLSQRKAVFMPYEGALPHASVVDEAACLRWNGQECDACVSACPFGNIDMAEQAQVLERQVGAIVLATGAESIAVRPVTGQSGILRWEAIERLLTSSGPTQGEVQIDGRPVPRRIALLHCTDDQGVGPTTSCSGLCCSAMDKYASLLRERLPDADIVRVLWDRCYGGKGIRQASERARIESASRWIRLDDGDRVTGVEDDGETVRIHLQRGDEVETMEADLAVVAPPMQGSTGIVELCAQLRVAIDGERFVLAEDEVALPFRSRVGGVVVAGGAGGPVNLRTAAAQGAAAAGSVLARFVAGRAIETVAETSYVIAEHCGGCRTCVVVCPYGAPRYDAAARAAVVDEALCRGCGACGASCPTGAMHCRHASDQQFMAELDAIGREEV